MTIRQKLSALLLLLLITSLANAYFIFQLEAEGIKKRFWIERTHQILLECEQLRGSFQTLFIIQSSSQSTPQVNPQLSPQLSPQLNQKLAHLAQIAHTQVTQSYRQLTQFIQLNQPTPNQHNREQQHQLLAIEQLMQEANSLEALEPMHRAINRLIYAQQLLLAEKKTDYDTNRTRMITLMSVVLCLFIVLAIGIYFYVSNHLFKPMTVVVENAKALELGKQVNYLDMLPNDEIGTLTKTFVKMSEKVYQREQHLENQANIDELTGLRNRLSLMSELANILAADQQQQSNTALLFLDLDRFKQINDHYGHEVGDQLLKEIASRLQQNTRQADHIYRIGGDELLVILPHMKSHLEVEAFTQDLLQSLTQPLLVSDEAIPISVSIGIVMSPEHSCQVEEMIRFADLAMYQAKRQGVGYCFYQASFHDGKR